MNGTLSRFRPFRACLFGEEKASLPIIFIAAVNVLRSPSKIVQNHLPVILLNTVSKSKETRSAILVFHDYRPRHRRIINRIILHLIQIKFSKPRNRILIVKHSSLKFQTCSLVVHVSFGILKELMDCPFHCAIWIKNRNRIRGDFLHVVATTSQAKASYQ